MLQKTISRNVMAGKTLTRKLVFRLDESYVHSLVTKSNPFISLFQFLFLFLLNPHSRFLFSDSHTFVKFAR